MIVGGWSDCCSVTCTVNDCVSDSCGSETLMSTWLLPSCALVGVQEHHSRCGIDRHPCRVRRKQAISQWIAGGVVGDGLVGIRAPSWMTSGGEDGPAQRTGARVGEDLKRERLGAHAVVVIGGVDRDRRSAEDRHRPGQEPGRRDRHSGRVARGQAEAEGIIIWRDRGDLE